MKVDPSRRAGAGIDGETLQFHDTADRYTLSGASAVATLYSTRRPPRRTPPSRCATSAPAAARPRRSPTTSPARSSTRARATRPGPGRSGTACEPLSIRPDDLFFGGKAGDVQPDWVDPNRFDVPQADEQQRLLANLITQMNLDKAPLPRFWYLPKGKKAAIVLTGDDHAAGGTAVLLQPPEGASPAGCSVADWECVRATSTCTRTRRSRRRRPAYESDGFEIALHPNTGCQDWTPASLENDSTSQLGAFAATWPNMTPPVSNRTHCIVWSDWASQPKIERRHGIRFDANYYYKGPPGWVKKPGLMTGSGFPQRFADSRRLDDRRLPVDDAGHRRDGRHHSRRRRRSTRCSTTRSARRYFGVSSPSSCTPTSATTGGSTSSSQRPSSRGVPIVSSAQMLTWLDGRNGSSFGNITYSADS